MSIQKQIEEIEKHLPYVLCDVIRIAMNRKYRELQLELIKNRIL